MPSKKPVAKPRKPGVRRVLPVSAAAFERAAEARANKPATRKTGAPAKRRTYETSDGEVERVEVHLPVALSTELRVYCARERVKVTAAVIDAVRALLKGAA